MLRRLDGFVAAAFVAALVWLAAWLGRPETMAGAVRVVDGDTIEMAGRRIRLLGLDAPESAQTCGEPALPVPCGARARDAMRRLVEAGPVTCAATGRDRYGRDLATCRAGAADLGAAMVLAGQAVAAGRYLAEEAAARGARRGIWAGPFVAPAEWRRTHARP